MLGLRDPSGLVRRILTGLDRTRTRFRNGRWIRDVELLTALISFVFQEADLASGTQQRKLKLVSKTSMERESIDALVAASTGAGAIDVEVVDAAEAIADYANSQSNEAQSYLVIDGGAGSVDISALEKRRGSYRQHRNIDLVVGPGLDAIDGMIWDRVRHDIDEDMLVRQEILDIRRQLRHIKEAFSRCQRDVELLSLSSSVVEVPRSLIIKVLDDFYDEVFSCIGDLSQSIAREKLGEVPLILAGGGSHLLGIERAIRDRGWDGPIIKLKQPDFAALLGADEAASGRKTNCPECGHKIDRNRSDCSNCGFPYKLLGTTFSSRPNSTNSSSQTKPNPASEMLKCQEHECGKLNPAQRTYCEKCGCPLPLEI